MQTNVLKPSPGVTPLPILRGRLAGAWAGAVPQRQFLTYLMVGVCTLVFLVYLPALSARARFLDDRRYVVDNRLVQNPSWTSVRRFFTEVWTPSTVKGYYQPLTMVSLMVDRFFAGPSDSMRVYHRTSLLLHVANTALVAVLLYRLFGQPLVAAGVALLFGLHPITVESVCWISERKTVLASFFALWSLILYVRFAREGKAKFYVGCFLTYLLALLSKPITVPLPAMMLLMDYWPLGRINRKAVTEKLPLFVLGTFFAVITYVSQSHTAPVFLPGHYNPLHVPVILCHNIFFYLYHLVWPVGLSAYYGFPSPMNLSHPMVLAGVVGTCILIPLLVVSRRWTPAMLTGWLIFFVMILPAMGIISVTPVIAADRYAYLPSLGFLLALAALLMWLLRRGQERASTWRYVGVASIVLVLAAGEGLATRRYLRYWQDTRTLHEYLLAKSPRSSMLHSNLAMELMSRGDMDGAVEHYRQALTFSPKDNVARYNLARALSRLPDKSDEAIQRYQEVLEASPALAVKAHLNIGNIFLSKGQLDEAIQHYRQAIDLKADLAEAHCNLGKMLTLTGQAQEGLDHLRRAVEIRPGFVLALQDLAWFLATDPNEEIRDPNEAVQLGERARALTRGRDVQVLDVLAAAYASDRQYTKAVETTEGAYKMAKRMRNNDLAGQIEERLRLYRQGFPYREDPRVQLDRLLARTKKNQAEHLEQDGQDNDLQEVSE